MIHEIEQNTEEWFQLRIGKITASNFSKIMANNGKAFGNPAKEYAMRIAIESKTGVVLETYTSDWMERGKLLEAQARELYEGYAFSNVLPGGFCEKGRFGASADGVPGPGLVEIKCVKYNTHFNSLIKGGYDTTYQWQIHGQMWVYDRPWCDFVSYCPDFPVEKQLYIFRVERDKEAEKIMIERLELFATEVDKYSEILSR